MKSCFLAQCLLFLTMLAQPLGAEFEMRPAAPGLAEIADGKATVIPDAADFRVLAAPALAMDAVPAWPESSPAILGVTVTAIPEAAVELSALYDGRALVPMGRRIHAGGGRGVDLLWEVPAADRVTSYTLAVRAPTSSLPVEFADPGYIDPRGLTLRERVFSATEAPLRLRSVLAPVQAGQVALRLDLPRTFRSFVADLSLTVEIASEEGRAMPLQSIDLELPKDDLGEGLVRIPVNVPGPNWDGPFIVRAWLSDGRAAQFMLPVLSITTTTPPERAYEVPEWDIVDFEAREHLGELALYPVVAEPAAQPRSFAVQPLADRVLLTVGPWPRWATEEERILYFHPELLFCGGGVHSFSLGTIGNRGYAFFTAVSSLGWESMGVATSVGSLRFTQSVKNPVWSEEDFRARQLGWRGNAFFDMNGGKLVVGLELEERAAPRARALMSDSLTRWIDMEEVPLPDLAPDARTLTAFSAEGAHYLLAGPAPQLYVTRHPLRGWSPVPFSAPEGWTNLRLRTLGSGVHLFGLQEINGRRAIVWQPAALPAPEGSNP